MQRFGQIIGLKPDQIAAISGGTAAKLFRIQ